MSLNFSLRSLLWNYLDLNFMNYVRLLKKMNLLLFIKFSEPTLKLLPSPTATSSTPRSSLRNWPWTRASFGSTLSAFWPFLSSSESAGISCSSTKSSRKSEVMRKALKRTFFYLEGRQCTKNCSVPFNTSFVILWCTKNQTKVSN